jgi:tetratricopeptide (TPR) repeat protein
MMKSSRIFLTITLSLSCFFEACSNQEGVNAQEKNNSKSSNTAVSTEMMMEVTRCDELAAHPKDPERMATGLSMDRIVPKLARVACTEEVKKYPKEARFHYQLGRAYYAAEQYDQAIKHFEKASKMNYAMAYYNLGYMNQEGEGFSINHNKAIQLFRKSVELGGIGEEQLLGLIFVSKGYSNPGLMQNLYDGVFNNIKGNTSDIGAYLTQFVGLFENTGGCDNIISAKARLKLAQQSGMNSLGKMFGMMAQAKKDRNQTGNFAAGYNAGQQMTENIVVEVEAIRQDAQLFYERHGCQSTVAKQIFGNIDKYTLVMKSATLSDEFYRNTNK